MKSRTKEVLSIAVLASMYILIPRQADGGQVSFTLPVRAHWGRVLLEPGRYTVEMPFTMSWPRVIVRGSETEVEMYPMTQSSGVETEISYLRLVNVGGSYFVREYVSAGMEKVFTFTMPRKPAPKLSTKAPDKKVFASEGGS